MWQKSGIYFTWDTYILPNTEGSIYSIGYFHVDSYHAQSNTPVKVMIGNSL